MGTPLFARDLPVAVKTDLKSKPACCLYSSVNVKRYCCEFMSSVNKSNKLIVLANVTSSCYVTECVQV